MEDGAEGFVEIERVLFCSPAPARPWRYGITPAAETTTVALWVDAGNDSCPISVRGEERAGHEVGGKKDTRKADRSEEERKERR